MRFGSAVRQLNSGRQFDGSPFEIFVDFGTRDEPSAQRRVGAAPPPARGLCTHDDEHDHVARDVEGALS